MSDNTCPQCGYTEHLTGCGPDENLCQCLRCAHRWEPTTPNPATPPYPYRFISDPGHGWLEVPLTEIRALGIAHLISGYSYVHGDFAYLEEDCDAPRFLRARFGEGKTPPASYFREVHQDPTPIRSYRRFDAHSPALRRQA